MNCERYFLWMLVIIVGFIWGIDFVGFGVRKWILDDLDGYLRLFLEGFSF